MRNRAFLHFSSAVITIIATVIGAILTISFMRQVAGNTGLELEFAVIGGLMDTSKALLPIAVIHLWQQQQRLPAFLLALLAVVLLGCSMLASIFAVDNGLASTQTESTRYQTITTQIEMKLSQAAELRQNASRFEAMDFISKGTATRQKAAQLEANAAQLMDKRDQLPPQNRVTSMANQISLGVALTVEWIAIGMSILFALTSKPKAPASEPQPEADPAPVTAEPPQAITAPQPVPEAEEWPAMSAHADIVAAILEGSLTPSIRGLTGPTALNRQQITELLDEMGQADYLEPYRNGWRLKGAEQSHVLQ
ncbi:hypothetical protein [Ferrimonas kyonanensis]|uniref:hypothetical protein n=1 Tax=Ferrimonas kyonanensis TaxID=364763 RepID=UPI000406BA4F|nr:hypothetical protein [Ferrimonas kyonanensis]